MPESTQLALKALYAQVPNWLPASLDETMEHAKFVIMFGQLKDSVNDESVLGDWYDGDAPNMEGTCTKPTFIVRHEILEPDEMWNMSHIWERNEALSRNRWKSLKKKDQEQIKRNVENCLMYLFQNPGWTPELKDFISIEVEIDVT